MVQEQGADATEICFSCAELKFNLLRSFKDTLPRDRVVCAKIYARLSSKIEAKQHHTARPSRKRCALRGMRMCVLSFCCMEYVTGCHRHPFKRCLVVLSTKGLPLSVKKVLSIIHNLLIISQHSPRTHFQRNFLNFRVIHRCVQVTG